MKNGICLDTGVIGLILAKNKSQKIKTLISNIKSGKNIAYIVRPVLIEVFYQICKIEGKEQATLKLTSFQHTFPVKHVDLDDSLVIKAGILKCQHRTTLSYIDCIAIALALNKKIEFHTTEKLLVNISQNTLQHLKIKTYSFD